MWVQVGFESALHRGCSYLNSLTLFKYGSKDEDH